MMSESGNGNWVVFGRLVTNLNLTFVVLVTEPLDRERVQRATLVTPRKMTLT